MLARHDHGHAIASSAIDVSSGLRDECPYTTPSLCDGCPVLKAGGCLEGFYGARVEMSENHPWVRLCLHRGSDPSTLMPKERFFGTTAFAELRERTQR